MSRRAGMLVALAAIAIVGAGAALAPAPFLRVEVVGGAPVDLVVPADGTFTYRYRQSVYDVLVDEVYRVEGDRLVQVEIRSADPQALEYYRLPHQPERSGDGYAIPGTVERLERIELLVLRDQRQELLLGARRFGLSRRLGDARVVLRALRAPKAAALLTRDETEP